MAPKDAAPKFDGPVVPWASSQPSELAERSPVSTPCQAADLAVHGQVDFEAYGNGGGIAVIALQNKGKQECRLEGSAAREARQERRAAAGEHRPSSVRR